MGSDRYLLTKNVPENKVARSSRASKASSTPTHINDNAKYRTCAYHIDPLTPGDGHVEREDSGELSGLVALCSKDDVALVAVRFGAGDISDLDEV